MAEKVNPWLDEGNRYDDDGSKRQKIRDLKFLDNTTHTVRIVSSKNPGEFPFHGYKQHWIPQNGSQTGRPITHSIDERCPVCEWVSVQWDEIHRLKEEEDMTDKSPEVESLFKKVGRVSAKTRYDMNVIHREDMYVENEETKEKELALKRMSVGATVYKEVFSFAKKWGSPSNEESGYDLEIITSGTKERREYRTIPDRDASPLDKKEKALIPNGYDLKELRKKSTFTEIEKVLENAKSPYDEIIKFLSKEDSSEDVEDNKKESVEDVEKEIKKSIKTEEKSTNKETRKKAVKKEQVSEDKSEQERDADTEEESNAVSDTETKQEEPLDDEHNIEVYECKGDYDENDKMCSDCPVKPVCENVHPFYVKAKQLKIDVDPHRPTKDVVDDVKKTDEKEEKPKRGKKIPF